MVQDTPNGLLYRRARRLDRGRVMIEEEWDIEAPGCPMIRNPWVPQVPGRFFIRQVILSDREYEQSPPPLFERSGTAGQ